MRPIDSPEWANDLSNIVEPAQGKKDIGHVAGEKPAAGFENWLKNLLSTYAREIGNAGFSQVRGAFIRALQDSTYVPSDMAHSIRYDSLFLPTDNHLDVWMIVNSQGTYEIVSDPYGKQSGTNYEHGDLPGSADSVAVNGVIYNDFFGVWIVVGDESSQAPYSSEPKIAHTTFQEYPLVAGDWTPANVGLSVNLHALDYSVVTGTTIAVGTTAAGFDVVILRSTDGGSNWTDVSPGGVALEQATSIYSPKSSGNPARGEFAVMGTTAGFEIGGLFSNDDGLTWTDISISNLLGSAGTGATSVTHNGRVWAATNLAAPVTEILTSADGLGWGAEALPALVPGNNIAADEAGGLIFMSSGYFSETDGQTWKRWTSLHYPDPLEKGDSPAQELQTIVVSATGQIGLIGVMNQRALAWFTPKQIMRNASYDNPDL